MKKQMLRGLRAVISTAPALSGSSLISVIG